MGVAFGNVARRSGVGVGRRFWGELAAGPVDDAECIRGFRGGVCGIPLRLRISQRAAPGTAYRARAFAARGEAACVFPRADQGARASGWRAFGGGTFGGCDFMAGGGGGSPLLGGGVGAGGAVGCVCLVWLAPR